MGGGGGYLKRSHSSDCTLSFCLSASITAARKFEMPCPSSPLLLPLLPPAMSGLPALVPPSPVALQS